MLDSKAKLIIGLIILLLFLTVVPVRAQILDQSDFVEALRARGLLTEIGESFTDGNVTITFDWGYADEHAVLVMITLYDPTYTDENAAFFVTPQISYVGPDGAVVPGMTTWANRIDLGNGHIAWEYLYTFQLDGAIMPDPDHPGETQWVDDYLSRLYGANLPETLTGALQVLVAQSTSAGPKFGPEEDAFQLALELPMYRAVTVAPNLTQTDQGLAVTVETVAVTPVSVQIRICSDLPDGGDWYPLGTVTLDGIAGQLSERRMLDMPSPEDVRRCFDYDYQLLSGSEPGTLTFNVDRLATSEPETREFWERVAAELAEHGVIIEVKMAHGGYYNMVSRPDDMTDDEFYTLLFAARENALPSIAGSWVFEVEIPAIG